MERLAIKHYEAGFFKNLGGERDPRWGLAYTLGPDWRNEVAQIAEKAGWHFAEQVLERRGDKPSFGKEVELKVPGEVMAACYGAARV